MGTNTSWMPTPIKISPKKAFQAVLLILSVGVLSTGCIRKKNDPLVGRIARGNGNMGSAIDPATGSVHPLGNCSDTNLSIGKIYDDPILTGGALMGPFRSRVALLISASMDPNQLGDVSGALNAPTGIDFSGRIKLADSGDLIPSQSELHVQIFDSNSYSGGNINPILIDFSTAQSGHFESGSNHFTALFRDRFGDVLLDGVSNGSIVTGVVSFKNAQSYTGAISVTPNYITLGAFVIRACGLFN